MSKTWNPSPSYLKVIFQPAMKACPVREGLKGHDVTVQGSEAAGKWDGRATVGHLGATTVLFAHSSPATSCPSWQIRNAEKGGGAVFMATGVSECQNTEASDATIGLWTFNWDIVWNSHKQPLFGVLAFKFSGIRDHIPEIKLLGSGSGLLSHCPITLHLLRHTWKYFYSHVSSTVQWNMTREPPIDLSSDNEH